MICNEEEQSVALYSQHIIFLQVYMLILYWNSTHSNQFSYVARGRKQICIGQGENGGANFGLATLTDTPMKTDYGTFSYRFNGSVQVLKMALDIFCCC